MSFGDRLSAPALGVLSSYGLKKPPTSAALCHAASVHLAHEEGTGRDPRRLTFGLLRRTIVTPEGVRVERRIVGPLIVPAPQIAAVTTHSPWWFKGDAAFLLCPGERPIMLWATGEPADATWESQQIAKMLDRPWVRWRDRRSFMQGVASSRA